MDMYGDMPVSVKDINDSPKNNSKKREAVNAFLTSILPSKRISSGEVESLKYKTLVLDSTRRKWSSTEHAKKKNRLTVRDKKELNIFQIMRKDHQFQDYIPLHRIWQDYMRDVLDFPRFAMLNVNANDENHERLLKADYHGCMLVVRKSKCPSLVGQSGIVLMETKNTFKIITTDNKIKCIPKTNSVFSFQLDDFLFSIYGSHFCVNAAMRVRRKFKHKGILVDL